ncbi:MAG: hypothetical protein ACPF8V_11385, partial [Luteibaculum sp.]
MRLSFLVGLISAILSTPCFSQSPFQLNIAELKSVGEKEDEHYFSQQFNYPLGHKLNWTALADERYLTSVHVSGTAGKTTALIFKDVALGKQDIILAKLSNNPSDYRSYEADQVSRDGFLMISPMPGNELIIEIYSPNPKQIKLSLHKVVVEKQEAPADFG